MEKQVEFYIHFTGMDYTKLEQAQISIDCREGWECKAGAESKKRRIPATGGTWMLDCADEITLSGNMQDSVTFRGKNVLECFLKKAQNNELPVIPALIKRTVFDEGQDKQQIRLTSQDHWGNVYFSGIVGVLGGDVLLEELPDAQGNPDVIFHVSLLIQSRMDAGTKKDSYGRAYFLATLLMDEEIGWDDNLIPGREEEVYDFLLLFCFREQLRAAIPKGYFRTYQYIERNDGRLRGNVDFPRHFRDNIGLGNGKIAYSYRENTVDNPVNHLLVAAYDCLRKKYPDLVLEYFDTDASLKKNIEYLRRKIGYGKYGSRKLISLNLKRIGHPYYTEYERLRGTCQKILQSRGMLAPGNWANEEISGVLANLPDLWENFLERQIRKRLPGDIIIKPQDEILVFEKKNDAGRSFVQRTFPDYVFYDGDKPFMILDAKFKPSKWEYAVNNTADNREGLKDVLEDYNKCLRDMVSIGAHATGVIFPVIPKDFSEIQNAGMDESSFPHSISEYNNRDLFYTFPVHIPAAPREDALCASIQYTDWRRKLEKSLDNTLIPLCSCVKRERDKAREGKMSGG